jgi:hypothetical protein
MKDISKANYTLTTLSVVKLKYIRLVKGKGRPDFGGSFRRDSGGLRAPARVQVGL